MSIKCGTCVNSGFFLRQKGNATGAYCDSCGKWIKWVGKSDVASLKRRGYVVHSEMYEPQLKVVESATSTPNLGVGDEPLPTIPRSTVSPEPRRTTNAVEPPSTPATSPSSSRSANPFDKQTGRVETVEVLDCQVCKFGVLGIIAQADGIEHNIFGNLLTFTETETSGILGSYKLDYCPGCGRKL